MSSVSTEKHTRPATRLCCLALLLNLGACASHSGSEIEAINASLMSDLNHPSADADENAADRYQLPVFNDSQLPFAVALIMNRPSSACLDCMPSPGIALGPANEARDWASTAASVQFGQRLQARLREMGIQSSLRFDPELPPLTLEVDGNTSGAFRP